MPVPHLLTSGEAAPQITCKQRVCGHCQGARFAESPPSIALFERWLAARSGHVHLEKAYVFPSRGIHACQSRAPGARARYGRRIAAERDRKNITSCVTLAGSLTSVGTRLILSRPKDSNMASSPHISAPALTKRRVGLAALTASIGCAACCAMPLLAAAGLSSGIASALSAEFRPGHELLVGGAVFVLALGGTAMWSRISGQGQPGCGSSCNLDGSCCDRGTARNAS